MEQEAWQVLIVEDDQRLAELTRDYLEANGLRVSIEGNGALAAARIIKEKPDLVILDLMLPGEDGLSISDMVERHELPREATLVEHNGVALRRRDWPNEKLAEGDRLEILQVAAGG